MKIALILCALLLPAPATAAETVECLTQKDWPFTFTEEDLETLESIISAKDEAAARQMKMQSRFGTFQGSFKVQSENRGKVSKFRVPGTTSYAYTFRDALICK